MASADVKKNLVDSLKVAPVGEAHHGRDFYKHFFTHHPEVRRYFKGAENYTGDDVEKSERFDKLGDAILLFVHILANTYDNEAVFRGFTRRLMFEHREKGISPELWKLFWGYWTAFLESKGAALNDDKKKAWESLGTRFNEESQKYLAVLGLPHT